MTTPKALSALTFSLLFLAGCAGATPSPRTEDAPKEESAKSEAASSEEADEGSAPSAHGARDPKIMELAKAALACKFEDESFDDECPGYKAWVDNDDLFDDGKGDDTVLSMFGDPDLKVRVLAKRKSISRSYFDDKGHAKTLFALAKAEKNDGIADELGDYVGKVDADKLGLSADFKALARHPSKAFRGALAFYVISSHQSPVAIEVEQMLIEDPEARVRQRAISALSSGGVTPGIEPVCKMLTKQLSRSDELAGDALWAGSSSKCAGMKDLVAAELAKRVADPSKVTNSVGISYALAADGICNRDASPELKKKAFEIGKKLTDPKVPDVNTRNAALSILAECDPVQGAKVLATLSRDKAKNVAEGAKKKLDDLNKKKQQKKK